MNSKPWRARRHRAADPDVIVRSAKARRSRRMIAGSALLVLVVALPLWLWVDGRGKEPAAVRVTLTFTFEGPAGSIERTRDILQKRAEAMRFIAPQAIVIDDHSIGLEAGIPEGMQVDWLATPWRLQIRKVLRATPGRGETVLAGRHARRHARRPQGQTWCRL